MIVVKTIFAFRLRGAVTFGATHTSGFLALFLALSFLAVNAQQVKSRIKEKAKWKKDLVENVQMETRLSPVGKA